MTHTLIYPQTARHDDAGHLEIGGCDVVELARVFGTPLFIYDQQAREIVARETLGDVGPPAASPASVRTPRIWRAPWRR